MHHLPVRYEKKGNYNTLGCDRGGKDAPTHLERICKTCTVWVASKAEKRL